jgi:hypothetical protein
LKLFHSFPEALQPNAEHLLDQNFSSDNYTEWKNKFLSKHDLHLDAQTAKGLLASPDEAAFIAYSYQLYDRLIPPIIPTAKVGHSSLAETNIRIVVKAQFELSLTLS